MWLGLVASWGWYNIHFWLGVSGWWVPFGVWCGDLWFSELDLLCVWCGLGWCVFGDLVLLGLVLVEVSRAVLEFWVCFLWALPWFGLFGFGFVWCCVLGCGLSVAGWVM